MKYSGLYFIPTPTAQPADSNTTASALISSLETHFHTLTRSSPWSLTYRLFRDVPPRADPSSDTQVNHAHTHQHFLTHSSLSSNRCYISIAPPSAQGPGTVAAIPISQSDAQAALLRNQLAALWSPRQTLSVQNGAAYEGGLFAVQIGELRALREQGGGWSSPGVVVCISVMVGGGEEGAMEGVTNGNGDDVDVEFAQASIRNLWGKIREGRDLGRAEVKEVFMSSERGTGDKDAAVRMWCEVLRLRG